MSDIIRRFYRKVEKVKEVKNENLFNLFDFAVKNNGIILTELFACPVKNQGKCAPLRSVEMSHLLKNQ
jgi:hypothetical protein